MFSKEPTRSNERSGSKKSLAVRNAGPSMDSSIIIQRATTEPGLLASDDILQLQKTIGNRATMQLLKARFTRPEQPSAHTPSGSRHDNGGLPDSLKAGVESLSGMSMDNVKVHYNSPKPSQLQALAYTQGTDIHLGPGQEKHLPHEAWHVVQQKQGRVQAGEQYKGVAINDDQGLEQEATIMGKAAVREGQVVAASGDPSENGILKDSQVSFAALVAQCMSLTQQGMAGGLEKSIDVKLRANDGPTEGYLYYTEPLVKEGAKSRSEALKWAMLGVRRLGIACQSKPGVGFMSTGTLRKYLIENKNGDRYKLGEWLTGYPLDGHEDYEIELRQEFHRNYIDNKSGITQEDLDWLRNNKEFNMFIDPFQFEVWVRYDGRYIGNLFKIRVEFGDSYKGYVLHVEDDEKDVDADMQTRPKYKDEEGTGIPSTYSQTHHVPGQSQSSLMDNIGSNKTKAENEAGIDAYTKVVAEGARWDCVADVGTDISDYTRFYFKPQKDVDRWIYITFENLWANWKAFDCKFGIKNGEVKEKMSGPLKGLVKETTDSFEIKGHYNLDK